MKRFKHGILAAILVSSVGLAGYLWFQIRQDAQARTDAVTIDDLSPADKALGRVTYVAPEQAPEDPRLAGLETRADGAKLLWSAAPGESMLAAGFADRATVVVSTTTTSAYRVLAVDLGTRIIAREMKSAAPLVASGHRQMHKNADRFCASQPNERGALDITCWDAAWQNPKRLTTHDGPEDLVSAAISPDGAWVVFEVSTERMKKTATRLGNTIWRIGLDGANLQQLTRGADDRNPTWSEDGGHIYFERGSPDGNWDMYGMSSDGNNASPILRTADAQERWINRVPGAASVIASVDGRVKRIDLDTKAGWWLTSGNLGAETNVSVSPDGKLFSFVAPIDPADPTRLGVWMKAIE